MTAEQLQKIAHAIVGTTNAAPFRGVGPGRLRITDCEWIIGDPILRIVVGVAGGIITPTGPIALYSSSTWPSEDAGYADYKLTGDARSLVKEANEKEADSPILADAAT